MKHRVPRARSHQINARQQSREGAAAVEFALVAPLFLTLVLGIVEIGQAFNVSGNLDASLRSAGRLASMDYSETIPLGTDANRKIIQDIRNMLSAGGFPGEKFTITITHAEGPNEGQEFKFDDKSNSLLLFRISAEIPYSDVGTIAGRILSGRKISGSQVFRMGRTSLIED